MIKRIALALAALVVAAAGLFLALFNWPDPLFPHSVTVGRLSLHSDRPFDPDKGRAILADIETRLASSPIDDHQSHGVYVANDPGLKKLFFFAGGGATGINYYPITNHVFISRSDIDADTVFGAVTGLAAKPPRTFAYYAAHEITHSFTAERLGAFKLWNRGLPQWIREGYADYVGTHGHLDVDDLYRRCAAGEPDFNFKKSGNYSSFRLLVAFMLERKHLTVDELLASKLAEPEALDEMNAAMAAPGAPTCKS